MSGIPKWAVGSNQYKKRPQTSAPARTDVVLSPPVSTEASVILPGVLSFDPAQIDVSHMQKSNTQRVLARFRAQLPELVWNAAALEGNTYTLPEVRTLLEGVTVAGKTLHEQNQIINLSNAYNLLEEKVQEGSFNLDPQTAKQLHMQVAVDEAIEAGIFRGEGLATGGGHVMLSTGVRVAGIEHGRKGKHLNRTYLELQRLVEAQPDPRVGALILFAGATRAQFFFDGNKRTARLLSAGWLMKHGFDAIGVPNVRRLEFNEALDNMFQAGQADVLMSFLASCAT